MKDSTIFDVALYILENIGQITAMKLQKLAFYAKAWGLVWDEEELFLEEFQAWANGAVSPALYGRHRGRFKVNKDLFSSDCIFNIPHHHKETIDRVITFYGKYTAQQLSDINHQEYPWIKARGNLPPLARCENVITIADMSEYYSGVWNDESGGEESTTA